MGSLSVIVVLLVLIYLPPLLVSLADQEMPDGLVFGLTRIENQNQTAEAVDIPELLHIARKKSSSRFHGLRKSRRNPKALNVSERLGIYRDGYVMSLRLGSPTQAFQVFMDTGSDLVWVPCLDSPESTVFDCIDCDEYHQRIDIFYPRHSCSRKPVSCDRTFCLDIHTSADPYDTCIMAGCSLRDLVEGSCSMSCPPFSYRYGDGIVTAELMRERIVLKGPSITKFWNFCFGCADAVVNEPIGIAGFGRGALSFPSQLGSALSYRAFSYCLVSYRFERYNSNVSSLLVLGASAVPADDGLIQYTPMLSSPTYPNYYYIGLQGISIDNIHLEVPLNLQEFDSEGNGGMIIDSGTTYTHLPETLYRKVLGTLEAIIAYPRSMEYENRTAFDLCYLVLSSQNYQGFPTITYHFQNNVTLSLPTENHFYAFSPAAGNGDASSKVHCFMLQSFEEVDVSGFSAILGNFQQQNIQVVYDTEQSRIGFELKDCLSSNHSGYNNIYN